MATTDDILIKWSALGWRLRIESAKSLWRAAAHARDDDEWSYVRPTDGSAGYPTPNDAAVAADTFLVALLAARDNTTAREQLTAVERVISDDRLLRRTQNNPDGSITVKYRIRQDDGNTFPGSFDTPHEAALAWIAAGAP